jgi:ribose transport system substrate-binding protein
MSIGMARRVVLGAAIAFLAACGSEQTAQPAAGRGLKIAVIAKSSTNPVFLSARTGAEAAAKELAAQHKVPVEIVWMTRWRGRPAGAAHCPGRERR